MKRQSGASRSQAVCVLLALLALGIGACSRRADAGAPAPRASYVVRVGHVTTGNAGPTGPEGWGYASGLLKKDLAAIGVSDVVFVHFPNGPDLNEAMTANVIDVGIVGDTPALLGKANGMPTRLINQSVLGLDVWLVGRKGGPRTVRDLDGQAVATSQGSYMSRYLLATLEANGLAKTTRVIHLLPSDAQAALERGDIAAYAAPINTGPLLVAKGYPLLDRASDHTGLTGSSVTVIVESFAAAHPDFAGAWNRVREESVRDLQAHGDAYYRFHAAQVGFPLEVVEASYPLTVFRPEPLAPEGLALLEGARTFLRDEHLLRADLSIQAWILPDSR
jgi:sulfonate transport system substrate-binding protein